MMRLRLGSVQKRWDSKYSLHLFRRSLASTLRPIFTFHVRKNTYCNYCVNLQLLNSNFGIRAVEEAHGLVAKAGVLDKNQLNSFWLDLDPRNNDHNKIQTCVTKTTFLGSENSKQNIFSSKTLYLGFFTITTIYLNTCITLWDRKKVNMGNLSTS